MAKSRTSFAPGRSGNPAGRPKALQAALLALDAIGAKAAEDVMRSVVTAAKNGDMRPQTSCEAACGPNGGAGRCCWTCPPSGAQRHRDGPERRVRRCADARCRPTKEALWPAYSRHSAGRPRP